MDKKVITELDSNEEFQETSKKIDEEEKNLEEARKELQDKLDKRETEPEKEENQKEEPELKRTENFGTKRDLGKPATWVKILIYAALILLVIVLGVIFITHTSPDNPVVEVPINPVHADTGSKLSVNDDLGKEIGSFTVEMHNASEDTAKINIGKLGSIVKSKSGSMAAWRKSPGFAAASREVAEDGER